ncbi:aspartic proteinase CDR1-like [Asparagus officinalis]|uniref:aspartic proteinase CDR1-like n=1 Tax=Asparagus officinalis TaxID=4686 RepID=UPI00098E3BBA|nr:aspartic proteinase CDR1-like [Asparagus officinalis]
MCEIFFHYINGMVTKHCIPILSPIHIVVMRHLLVLLITSLFISHSDSEIGFQIRVLPKSSHLSPYFDPSLTILDLLRAEKRRLEYIHSAKLNNDTSLPIGFYSGLYLGEISVGSSEQKTYLELDTGSHLIWFDGDECENCGSRKSLGFNPDNSATYKFLKCDHPICQKDAYYCDPDTETCRFRSTYEDGSFSTGFMGIDNFHVSDHYMVDVVFGCADQDFRNGASVADGILGLGLGEESFTSQAKVDRFSYCMPPEPPKDAESYSKMLFGSLANIVGETTPFLLDDGLYNLKLVGVSFISTKLNISSLIDDGYMNMTLDTGTMSIWLDPPAYEPLAMALNDALDSRHLYGNCYHGTMEDFNWINITFQFYGGVDVNVPASGIFFEDDGKYCAYIFQNEYEPSILGMQAQMNYNVGYDLANKQISFLATDCTDPNFS